MPQDDSATSDDTLGIFHFALTATGDRARNEDSHGHAFADGVATFVVSDGVGGHGGGEQASRLVVATTRRNAGSIARADMLSNYGEIEREMARQQQAPGLGSMSATICELRIDAAQQLAVWGHLGDSRLYWIRDGEIRCVTRDHSAVKSLVDAGLISVEEAGLHPQRSTLLGAFGAPSAVEPEILSTPVEICERDAFLLCTDGLWSVVPESAICESLRKAVDVKSWITTLGHHVEIAQCPDKDNYTALGVWITPPELKTMV